MGWLLFKLAFTAVLAYFLLTGNAVALTIGSIAIFAFLFPRGPFNINGTEFPLSYKSPIKAPNQRGSKFDLPINLFLVCILLVATLYGAVEHK